VIRSYIVDIETSQEGGDTIRKPKLPAGISVWAMASEASGSCVVEASVTEAQHEAIIAAGGALVE